MEDQWQLVHKKSAELAVDFFLKVVADEGYSIECTRDSEGLQRIIPEH